MTDDERVTNPASERQRWLRELTPAEHLETAVRCDTEASMTIHLLFAIAKTVIKS